LLLALPVAQGFQIDADLDAVAAVAPKLATFMKRAMVEPDVLAKELASSPIAQVVREGMIVPGPKKEAAAGALPIVVTHGMGDSCFNGGMKQITEAAGSHMGVYSVCVPGGDNDISDTLSGFLTTMDKNVDIFAEKVRKDPKLAGVFNAFGLSQGNSVIRGYIERYNNPPVKHYLSVHGTIMGVSGFPNCNPAGVLGSICDTLDEVLGDLAYTELVQNILFQANYFRDPTRMGTDKAYLEHSQIAQWNNENVIKANATFKTNFASVEGYAMVKAMKDTMVFPNEGEWWGEFKPGQFKEVQKLTETDLYANDLFGLKTVDQAGKFKFNSTTGEHLQFTVAELEGWLDMYW
jgi:palmitoyl-protein thioesterase